MVDDESGTPQVPSTADRAGRDDDLRIHGLTVQRDDPGFALQAQLKGTLEIQPSTNCLVVRTGNTLVDVAWPQGWSVAIREGTIVLIDASGQTAGRLGDEVWVGGGSLDADQADVASCTGRKQVFVASGLSNP